MCSRSARSGDRAGHPGRAYTGRGRAGWGRHRGAVERRGAAGSLDAAYRRDPPVRGRPGGSAAPGDRVHASAGPPGRPGRADRDTAPGAASWRRGADAGPVRGRYPAGLTTTGSRVQHDGGRAGKPAAAADPAGPEAAGPDPGRPESAWPDLARPDLAPPEPARPDGAGPDTARNR